jgi:hypothetical protein
MGEERREEEWMVMEMVIVVVVVLQRGRGRAKADWGISPFHHFVFLSDLDQYLPSGYTTNSSILPATFEKHHV